jgi:ribosome-associated protein
MIRINHQLSINENEILEVFVRSSGPGGQNVNKVATAVQLRFDIRNNASLPDEVKQRLIRIAGNSVNRFGVLTIIAQRFRRQERNRKDARDRLISLIHRAAQKPKIHKKTATPYRSRIKRMESKRQRSDLKSKRKSIQGTDD